MVFVADAQPSEHPTAKAARPYCTTIEEESWVTAGIRHHLEKTPRMANPKRLNTPTNRIALARTFHQLRTPPLRGMFIDIASSCIL